MRSTPFRPHHDGRARGGRRDAGGGRPGAGGGPGDGAAPAHPAGGHPEGARRHAGAHPARASPRVRDAGRRSALLAVVLGTLAAWIAVTQVMDCRSVFLGRGGAGHWRRAALVAFWAASVPRASCVRPRSLTCGRSEGLTGEQSSRSGCIDFSLTGVALIPLKSTLSWLKFLKAAQSADIFWWRSPLSGRVEAQREPYNGSNRQQVCASRLCGAHRAPRPSTQVCAHTCCAFTTTWRPASL